MLLDAPATRVSKTTGPTRHSSDPLQRLPVLSAAAPSATSCVHVGGRLGALNFIMGLTAIATSIQSIASIDGRRAGHDNHNGKRFTCLPVCSSVQAPTSAEGSTEAKQAYCRRTLRAHDQFWAASACSLHFHNFTLVCLSSTGLQLAQA